jgi:hypothetical protein
LKTEDSIIPTNDICVIGAGPAGITAALELAELGLCVSLIESGLETYDEFAQRLSDATIETPTSHSVMEDAVRRGLGGTSTLWGGRCVPLDPVDFENRDFVEGSGWPLETADISPYYLQACEILGVGAPGFEAGACLDLPTKSKTLSAGFEDTATIRASELERWSGTPDTWLAHKSRILAHPRIKVLQGRTCIGFRQGAVDGAVTEAIVRLTGPEAAASESVKARVFVIACGGIESTRLVLNSQRDPLGLKLRSAGQVGCHYMGHPSGKIADIELAGKPQQTIYGFERDGGVYVRRRITFLRETLLSQRLLNIAFWLDNPPLSDWWHGSGVLSAAYLALTAPFLGELLAPAAIRKRALGDGAMHRWKHLLNCLRSPLRTVLFCFTFFFQRYLAKRRLPGFFTYSRVNRYALHYHAEQAPNGKSAITLSEDRDAHGLYRARIALEWSEQDIDSIVRAHQVLDKALQEKGIGRLIYRFPSEALHDSIREQAVDGFHQVGTLRMAADESRGVTDSFGRLFGVPNVYVASSAIFPTSGQANPTLALCALTIRQARHIASLLIGDVKSYA